MNPREIWIFVDDIEPPFVREEIVFHAGKYSAVRLVSRKPLVLGELEPYVKSVHHISHQRGSLRQLLHFRLWFWLLSDLLSKGTSQAYWKRWRYNLSYLLRCIGAANELIPLLRKNNQNKPILLSYWFADWALTLSWLKASGHISAFYSRAHGRDVFEDREPKTGKLPFRLQQIRAVESVFTVSAAGRDYIQARYPAYAEKIHLQYLGTSDQGEGAFDPASRPTLLTCARVRNVKRIYLMPQILQHMKTPVRWVHIGDENLQATNDPTMAWYKEGKEALKAIPDRVETLYTGPLPNAEIFKFYRENTVNLFLNLSETEGLPFVLIEAISMGIPLMATDVGGCREIANQNTGVLLEANPDPAAVAAQIDRFLVSSQNSLAFRRQVRTWWSGHFRAENNLMAFVTSATKTA